MGFPMETAAHLKQYAGFVVLNPRTGETWLAMQAQQRGLVDSLMTSEEYLRSRMADCDVLLVQVKSLHTKKN
jgi:ClpP class serine protease